MHQLGTVQIKIVFYIFILQSLTSYGQKSKSQLEREKSQNLQKITEVEKILKETRKKKRSTIGEFQALKQQIVVRQQIIEGIQQEVNLLNSEINELSSVVLALQNDLDKMKEEYSAMVYSGYKANTGFKLITFIFSSQTFNQFFIRLKYLEQYAEARTEQAQQIMATSTELSVQMNEVAVRRDNQTSLLSEQVYERKKLLNAQTKVTSIIRQLTKKESDFKNEMTRRRKAVERLEITISAIVSADANDIENLSEITIATNQQVTINFEKLKSKLVWPVASGFISKKFGTQPHPVLKRIKTENNGVDIQTNGNETVRSVHDGEVKMVGFLQGMNNFVMIKHGNYFTVYSRLKSVSVKRGQLVKKLDELGNVYTDSEGVSEVHFEVWQNTTKLDPEKWLNSL